MVSFTARVYVINYTERYINRGVTLTQTHDGDLVGEILTLLLGVTSHNNGEVTAVSRPLHRDLHITAGNRVYLLDICEGDGLNTAVGLDIQNHHSRGLAIILRDDVGEVGADGRPGILGDRGNAKARLGYHLDLREGKANLNTMFNEYMPIPLLP